MKVPLSIREAYDAQLDGNLALRKVVDDVLRNLKRPRWHYESRIKEVESFAIKVESGRVSDPQAIEDFFGCTLVVPNSTELQQADTLVRSSFDVLYQRPRSSTETTKSAASFPFDDLRLYVTRKRSDAVPPVPIDSIVFEIQLKTFLQHAWAIATHDLNYKTDDVRWSKDRLAAHLKALIEHAELSIQEAVNLSQSELLSKTDAATHGLREIIDVLQTQWVRSDLPENIRGLAQALQPILAGLRINSNRLNDLLNEEKVAGRGSFDLNLSPYGVIMQALLRRETAACTTLFTDTNSRARLVLTREIQLPAGLDPSTWPQAIVIP